MNIGRVGCADGKTESGYVEKHRPERTRVKQWRRGGGNSRPADLQKTNGQAHEHLCDTGVPAQNGNLGNDRTTTTKAASVRKQMGTKICKSNEGRHQKNG